MLANQKCDVVDILSPVALAYGLLKQRTEFFSDKLMNGERTHRHTGPVQVQLLEGIDLITEADLDIKNPACLAVRQPGFFTCAPLGGANADPERGEFVIFEVLCARHLLHRLHSTEEIGVAELDRGARQNLIQFGDDLFRQVGGLCHRGEINIPGDPIAFESQGHDRPALQNECLR